MSATIHLHPRLFDQQAKRRLRDAIDRTIEVLLNALDALDGDPDLEPWLGAPDVNERVPQWPRGGADDREEPDEDGGDILDEPHDAEPDEHDGRA